MDAFTIKLRQEFKDLVKTELKNGCTVLKAQELYKIYSKMPEILQNECQEEKELLFRYIK